MTEQKSPPKRIICAIYTRKSTNEGLDQDFTSLDNQRESAESYIKSQQHEGWNISPELYDDGGFTGANIERPGLQKLLTHIKEGHINCVVVYKVDRLSRSLMDFTQLLEFFDKSNVTFVSVTQHFNTNTSMGRLTLNILLSFAQFEREIISERTKDKMSAIRKKGQWLGGRPPIGYDLDRERKKLIINETEVELIKEIYQLYLKGNSLLGVTQILNSRGLRTKRVESKNGKIFGGNPFDLTNIQSILKNVLYIGKVIYGGQIYAGQQPAIVDEETFGKVQEKLAENRRARKTTKKTDGSGLLSRLLKCKACGYMMSHTYTLKKGNLKYRYYQCNNAQKRGFGSCPNKSINAQTIEDEIISYLRKTIAEHKPKKHSPETEALLSSAWDTLFFEEKQRIIKTFLKEIDCNVPNKKIGLTFHDSNIRIEFDTDVKKPRYLNKAHKKIELRKEPRIRKALILAHQLQNLINKGDIKGSAQASKWLNISQAKFDHILSLLNLSPTIQKEIILDSNTYLNFIPEYKLRSLAAEFDWKKQIEIWKQFSL